MALKNKRGIATFGMVLLIIFGFFVLVFMMALSLSMGLLDDTFVQLGGTINNVSLNETYIELMQPGVQAIETTVPNVISLGVLVGMVLMMLIVGYQKKLKQMWAILDIVILIGCEALGVLVNLSFQAYLDSNEQFVAIARDTLPGAAKFILNLPILIPIIGSVVMLATYITLKGKEREEIAQAGF